MKRIISIILATILLVSIMTLGSFNVFATREGATSGAEGNIKWTFDETTSTLTISGEGEIVDLRSSRDWNMVELKTKKLVIGDKITRIGDWAFNYFLSLEMLDLGKVKEIGESAFQNCTSLKELKIPNSVKVIEEDAFFGDLSLKTLSFKAKATIGKYAFGSCEKLEKVDIPNVTSIGKYAFADCKKLKEVNAPKAVVKGGAFADSKKIKTVVAKELKSAALYNFDKLKSVQVNGNVGDVALFDCDKLTKLTIKGNVGDSAISNCDKLKIVNLSGTTKIGSNAFRECKNLIKIVNLNKVKTIGVDAFYNCPKLAR